MKKYEHGGDIYKWQRKVVDFSANINPLGMPKEAKDAIINHINEYEVYPDHFNRRLCDALAKYLDVSSDDVLAGNGAADLIFRLCLSLRPKEALIIGPTFSEYEEAVIQAGGNANYYIMKPPFEFDEKDLALVEDKIAASDVVFLCSPNNPNGSCCNLNLIYKMDLLCKENNTLLVVDQCFIELANKENEFSLLNIWDKLSATVILRAFTKSFAMAGIRLGYMLIKDHRLLDKIESTLQPWPVSSIASYAGIGALEAARSSGYLTETRQFIKLQRKLLVEGLIECGFKVFDGEANFILFFAEPLKYGDVAEKLSSYGFLIRDCSNFVGLSKGYYRIAVRTFNENQLLLQAMTNLFKR